MFPKKHIYNMFDHGMKSDIALNRDTRAKNFKEIPI